MMRRLSVLDQILSELDTALRTVIAPPHRATIRPSPARIHPSTYLTTTEKQHVAGLMRVNHAGEVCAQALYQGQALTAKLESVRMQMAAAASEEVDHLAWCEERLGELHERPSILNPMWYMGSFCLGAIAGMLGDRFSLGFVAETERQVTAHLKAHLQRIPPQDIKTHAILTQMEADESKHAETAVSAGAIKLPIAIRQIMRFTAKLLTVSSYYV